MILNRAKQTKTDTPCRISNGLHRVTQPASNNSLASSKKSDPFLRELKEVYDK